MAAGIVAAMGACGDPLGVTASLAVQTDSLAAYAMTGTPPAFPAALNSEFRSVVRADADFNFDIAFDLDAQNNVKVIPVKLVGGLATADRTVGLQKVTGTFEDLTKAPGGTYQTDSVLVLRPGETFVMQVLSSQCPYFSVSQLLYSKIGIDSVDVGQRKVHFRLTLDPNCGFRSFKPGIPKD